MNFKKVCAMGLLWSTIGTAGIMGQGTVVKAAEKPLEASDVILRSATGDNLVFDQKLEEREVSRQFLGTVSVTEKVVFEPAVTFKGVTVRLARWERSETGTFNKYNVGTYYKLRFKNYNGAGMFIGYQTIESTLYHTKYEAIGNSNEIGSTAYYNLKFQQFYNNATKTSSPISEDGLYGPATANAYRIIGQLIDGSYGNYTPGGSSTAGSRAYYILKFQQFYNNATKTSSPIAQDGLYGPATANAYGIIGRLLNGTY